MIPRGRHRQLLASRDSLFERALALVYLVAFLVAANQFVPLLGERGLLPVPRFVQRGAVSRRAQPVLSPRRPTPLFAPQPGSASPVDSSRSPASPNRLGAVAVASVWRALWVLYLSFVNVGQTFYAFGWETLLLEAGFLAIFAGAQHGAAERAGRSGSGAGCSSG